VHDHVFVCGYPSEVGGANTELWHTVKLWRRFGLRVTLIPTWKADPRWKARLDRLGCRTIQSHPEDLQKIPNLAGQVVVSMCNTKFLAVAERFRQLGCKIVWLGCMNWLFPEERQCYSRCGVFDYHVFQSRYQRDQLAPQLRRYGYRDCQGQIIRGALDLEAFPYRPLPHRPGTTFVVGRISRPSVDKFSPRTWDIYERIPHKVRARVLGWSPELQARLGPAPRWAECLPAGAQTPGRFLRTLHALVQAGGQAVENWPRVGLEAMAAGVPVVAEKRGGWAEMIRHGQTGYLCEDDDQFAYYAARLAYDDQHRLRFARQARRNLEEELAHPQAIWSGWKTLLASITP
jgi:hypothetical protein